MDDFKKDDHDPVNLKAGRSNKMDFRSRRIGGSIKSFVETLPAVDTQAVIGNDNSRVKVTSIGRDESSTGYFSSLQKKLPSYDSPAPQGLLSNIPLLGILGGPRVRISKIFKDSFFSLYCKQAREESGVHISSINSMSADTLSYIKPLLDTIAMARKTSATYMPILNVTFDVDKDSKIKSFKGYQWYNINNTSRLWFQSHISIPEFTRWLNCSEADLASAFYILQADKDMSYLAYQLQMFIDIAFNSYDKLYQVFYNNRDTVRLLYAYTRRSAVQKPVQLLAQIIKSQKVVSGNFYNLSDYAISRVQQETRSSSSPLCIAEIEYTNIDKMRLISRDSSIGNAYTPFDPIFPKWANGTADADRFEAPAVGSQLNFSVYTNQFDYYTLLRAISQDDVDAAIEWIQKVVDNIKRVTPTVSSKYASLLALTSEEGVNLGLKTTDLPLMITKEPENPSYHEFIDVASMSSYSTYVRNERQTGNAHGEYSRWFQLPEYSIDGSSIAFRTSIDAQGNYPSLMNSNMFVKNVPTVHDACYHAFYPSGVCIIFSSFFNAEMEGYGDNYTAKGNIYKFASDYKKFINYFAVRTLGFKYSVTSSTHKVSFVTRPNVLLEDVILTTPDIQMVDEFGMLSSPYSKGSTIK